jgi:hypothetical protein
LGHPSSSLPPLFLRSSPERPLPLPRQQLPHLLPDLLLHSPERPILPPPPDKTRYEGGAASEADGAGGEDKEGGVVGVIGEEGGRGR